MSSKKKLRFKKRRTLTREELFKKKADLELLRMNMSLEQAFPDPVKRLKYMDTLIEKFEGD